MGIYSNNKGVSIFTYNDKIMEDGVICYEDCVLMVDLFVYNNNSDNNNSSNIDGCSCWNEFEANRKFISN